MRPRRPLNAPEFSSALRARSLEHRTRGRTTRVGEVSTRGRRSKRRATSISANPVVEIDHMKLTIFESDKGDCLLLEAASGNLMLCDGGMTNSLTKFVRAELSALRDDDRELDLVYVSHIDNDHISGVLQLLLDEAEWRVFDLHAGTDDPIREPKVPRPPVIRGILHNAFRDQVPANKKALANLLIASAPSLYASGIPEMIEIAD